MAAGARLRKTMKFKSDLLRLAYEKTREFAYSLFGEVNVESLDGLLALREGSTIVYLRVFPIESGKAGVEVFSYVAADVVESEELMRFLLTYNLKLVMGGFGLLPGAGGKATVLLTQTMLADVLTETQLYATVSAIAGVADRLDDVIVNRFGGRTAINLLARGDPHERWE